MIPMLLGGAAARIHPLITHNFLRVIVNRPWFSRGNPKSFSKITKGWRPLSTDVEALSEREYNRVSTATLDSLCEQFERIIDELDLDGADCELSGGVLTLRLGSGGTYVINRQPANRQIWLSSPARFPQTYSCNLILILHTSGPKRYDLSHGQWLYSRDGGSLHGLLEEELSNLFHKKLSIKDQPPAK